MTIAALLTKTLSFPKVVIVVFIAETQSASFVTSRCMYFEVSEVFGVSEVFEDIEVSEVLEVFEVI